MEPARGIANRERQWSADHGAREAQSQAKSHGKARPPPESPRRRKAAKEGRAKTRRRAGFSPTVRRLSLPGDGLRCRVQPVQKNRKGVDPKDGQARLPSLKPAPVRRKCPWRPPEGLGSSQPLSSWTRLCLGNWCKFRGILWLTEEGAAALVKGASAARAKTT